MEQRLIDANELELDDAYSDWEEEYTAYSDKQIKHAPTVLTIPKNPTNGDMIKAMFPQYIYENITYKVCLSENEWKPSRKVIRMNGEHSVDFDIDWWKAPYERE